MDTVPKIPDRGELVSAMEPLLLGDRCPRREAITDLAFTLTHHSAGFFRALPPASAASLAGLVRSMNCYYSNLIEGHNTHPIDIERALQSDYSQDAKRRDLQLEAKAHIAVQTWIDTGGLAGGRALTREGICEIHRRFCEELPQTLLWLEDPETGERFPVVPGELRHRDVQVGDHVPVSPGALPRFLDRFAEVYSRLGKAEATIAIAAAHHRLLWIHPFVDGNGRVARLLSHAMLLDRVETGGVWSVARGLARRMPAYKSLLANCDRTRRNDLDGRGVLSEEALAQFTEFFLQVCIDQVTFMETLVQPDRLRARVLLWAQEEMRVGGLPANSDHLLDAVLYRGELPRGETARAAGTGERQARRVVAALIQSGALTAAGPRDPLRLGFPAVLAERWLPGLFPASPDS